MRRLLESRRGAATRCRSSQPRSPRRFRRRATLTLLSSACAVLATALLPSARSAAAAPNDPMGVYTGPSNVSAAQQFDQATGGRVHYAMDFLDPTSWSKMDQPFWFFNNWHGSGFQMIWGVPMLPNDGSGSLATGATGAYDHYFETLAQELVGAGQGNSVIRLGWEFNGGWFPWAAAANPTAFIDYWRQIVTTMRAVPGSNFQFEWNPTIGSQQIAPDKVWPGSQYVDIVGLDLYDAQWPALQSPAAQWNTFLTEPYGLDWLASFGASMDKPLALPEWGLWNDGSPEGSGDNTSFIDQVNSWINTHNVVNAEYWDYGTSAFTANPAASSELVKDLKTQSLTPQSNLPTAPVERVIHRVWAMA